MKHFKMHSPAGYVSDVQITIAEIDRSNEEYQIRQEIRRKMPPPPEAGPVDVAFKLAGVTEDVAQHNIRVLGRPCWMEFDLIREYNNPYDANAISVRLNAYHLGYVPREIASWLAPQIDFGRSFSCRLTKVNKHPRYETRGLTVRIYRPGCGTGANQERGGAPI
jgi:hypothetical protein